jgi:hypothetical protein
LESSAKRRMKEERKMRLFSPKHKGFFLQEVRAPIN